MSSQEPPRNEKDEMNAVFLPRVKTTEKVTGSRDQPPCGLQGTPCKRRRNRPYTPDWGAGERQRHCWRWGWGSGKKRRPGLWFKPWEILKWWGFGKWMGTHSGEQSVWKGGSFQLAPHPQGIFQSSVQTLANRWASLEMRLPEASPLYNAFLSTSSRPWPWTGALLPPWASFDSQLAALPMTLDRKWEEGNLQPPAWLAWARAVGFLQRRVWLSWLNLEAPELHVPLIWKLDFSLTFFPKLRNKSFCWKAPALQGAYGRCSNHLQEEGHDG